MSYDGIICLNINRSLFCLFYKSLSLVPSSMVSVCGKAAVSLCVLNGGLSHVKMFFEAT